jgi:hypothetical protein
MLRPTILSWGSGLGTRDALTFERPSSGKNAVRQPHRVRNPSRSLMRWSFDVFKKNPETMLS